MPDERTLLQEYVDDGKLMQLATRDGSSLSLSNVWYRATYRPDRLYFISNVARNHSRHIRDDGIVAGGIMHETLDGLGQKVRGVTFQGSARELPSAGIDEPLEGFLERWPGARDAIDAQKLAAGETPMRLYEVEVAEWILFDEVNFPEQPRRVIAAD